MTGYAAWRVSFGYTKILQSLILIMLTVAGKVEIKANDGKDFY